MHQLKLLWRHSEGQSGCIFGVSFIRREGSAVLVDGGMILLMLFIY